MTSKTQTSFFIKSQKQNNQNKYNNSFKKNKTISILKKTHFSGRSGSSGTIPEEQLLPEGSSGNLKGHPEEPVFRKNHFFRKVSGRGVPGVFRKKCSSGRTFLPETFRNRFPELPEEPLLGLPEDSAVSHFPHFFGILSSSTLR